MVLIYLLIVYFVLKLNLKIYGNKNNKKYEYDEFM